MNDFSAYTRIVRKYIKKVHNVRVRRLSIPGDFLGDLNGIEIRVDPSLNAEEEFFTIAHLFGHTVQWNLGKCFAEIRPPADEKKLEQLVCYETEAAAYSMQVLLDCGFEFLGQWLSDYSAADLRYLTYYYRTGEKRSVQGFWVSGEPRLAPLKVPPFKARAIKWRWEGIVL